MEQYQKVDVEYELFKDSGKVFVRQYADKEDAKKAMKEHRI